MGAIISHRGRVAQGPPENTVQAFDAAVSAGAEGIETDVRLDADGEAVLFHDRTVADGRRVEDLTRAEIATAVGHEIPTVDEVLTRWPDILWNLEIKAPAAVAAVAASLERCQPTGGVLVTSFDHPAMVRASAEFGLETGWLYEARLTKDVGLFERAAAHRIRIVVPYFELLDDEVIAQARKDGLSVWTYGPTTPADHEQCFRWRLRAVITDYIDRALAARP